MVLLLVEFVVNFPMSSKAEWASVILAVLVISFGLAQSFRNLGERVSAVEVRSEVSESTIKTHSSALERTLIILSKLEERTKGM